MWDRSRKFSSTVPSVESEEKNLGHPSLRAPMCDWLQALHMSSCKRVLNRSSELQHVQIYQKGKYVHTVTCLVSDFDYNCRIRITRLREHLL